jgi:hypothetical protein
VILQHPYWKPVHPRRLTILLLSLISSRQTPLGTRVPWTPRCCALHMRTAVRSFLFRIIESRFMMDEQGALRGVFRSGHLAPAEFRTADTPPIPNVDLVSFASPETCIVAWRAPARPVPVCLITNSERLHWGIIAAFGRS